MFYVKIALKIFFFLNARGARENLKFLLKLLYKMGKKRVIWCGLKMFVLVRLSATCKCHWVESGRKCMGGGVWWHGINIHQRVRVLPLAFGSTHSVEVKWRMKTMLFFSFTCFMPKRRRRREVESVLKIFQMIFLYWTAVFRDRISWN